MPGFLINTIAPTPEENRFEGRNFTSGPSNLVDTARKYRWIFESLTSAAAPVAPFGENRGTDGILLYAHKCGRPTYETEDVVIHSGLTEIHRPGKVKWNPIEMSFYEKIYSSSVNNGFNTGYNEVADKIYTWWRAMIDTSYNLTYSPSLYTKDAVLKQLDGAGSTIYTYFLYNCWPIKVSPDDLDYSNSDISEITVTIRYDKAEEKANR